MATNVYTWLIPLFLALSCYAQASQPDSPPSTKEVTYVLPTKSSEPNTQAHPPTTQNQSTSTQDLQNLLKKRASHKLNTISGVVGFLLLSGITVGTILLPSEELLYPNVLLSIGILGGHIALGCLVSTGHQGYKWLQTNRQIHTIRRNQELMMPSMSRN